ncbi:LysR family transcriptional regulator [Roseibium aestuarii]|uniref:LysR family transcriptional regulator n=1 Tax=Roseibium aestuarii TaxID=2600299 RepID=A0ABW4K082_9HYPH|nr:LysR family transcriptional regulator [Roseibium aestuarii]
MDWNAVKVFLAVCETGSLVKAAKRIGVSHATVFRHMSALEEQVGTRLFDRVKGRYLLTDAGNEMREIGIGIVRSFEEIDRRVAGRDESAGGTVRLTAPYSFACTVLPRYLAQFSEAQPDISVELLVSNQEMNMSDRSADVALRVAEAPPEQLWGRRILSIDWAVYAAPAYLKTNAPLQSVEDLPQHRLIAPAGQLARHPAYGTILAGGQPLSAVCCDDLTTIASLAAEGHGATLLPDDMRRSDLSRLFAYPLAPPNCLWVLTHPDLRDLKRVTLLMGFLSNAFRRDPYWAV